MNDNPYKSPTAQDSAPIQLDQRFSDQTLARRLLKAREQGYSLEFYLRWNARQYSLLLVLFGLLFVGLAYLELWMPFYIMLGLLWGHLARDLAWVRSVTRSWPFNDKVIDWNKVEQLADEQN